jgi:hypothetical protein
MQNARLVDYSDVITEAMEKINSRFPTATTQAEIFGFPVGHYSGVPREKLVSQFTKADGSALTHADVDQIAAALNVSL